jgi:hypothetical protein
MNGENVAAPSEPPSSCSLKCKTVKPTSLRKFILSRFSELEGSLC